jgi:DNA-binding SARP family transcriptional activator/TolB-like protein/Tfp pilus assembly protein PilF
MQLQLLGGFALAGAGADAPPVSLRRGQALLAYLALKETRAESREVLLDLLWPDRFKEQAQASLRQVLFELRAAAGEGGAAIVEATRTSVALGAGITQCDVWEFESLPSRDGGLGGVERMLRLYRGPLLDGPPIGAEPFGQWMAIQRARLEGRLESAVLEVTARNLDAHEQERAVQALQRLIELSPMCGQAVLRRMSIEAAAGRGHEALLQYERHARRLKLEFDEEPAAELRQAYEAIKAAPQQIKVPAVSLRRPAYVHADPWLRTRGDAPVLAVLPFRYEGPQASGAALASALSEDITMVLSGCRWFSVLSRATTHSLAATGPGAPFIARDFARLTGADYLIYGAIVDRGSTLSLGIELAGAETGHIRWANRYDAASDDPLSWVGEVCPLIVAALDPAIADIERRAFAKPALAATGSAVAYQHLVLGYRHFYAGDLVEAAAAFRNAIREDATYAHAHAMLAVTTYLTAQVERDHRWSALLAAAEKSARRALEIDPSEPKGCNIMGQVLDWQGRHEEAASFLEQAVSLNPSFALSSTARSYHAVMTGAFAAAKTYLQTAMRLRVGDASLGHCLPSKVLADLNLGNREEALQTAHWAARLQPHFWLGRQVLAASLSAAGALQAASEAVAGLQRDYPGLTAEQFVNWFPYAGGKGGELVTEALRRAGWR